MIPVLAAGAASFAYAFILLATQPFHAGILAPAFSGLLLTALALAPPGSLLQTLCLWAMAAICLVYAALLILLGLGSRATLTPQDTPEWILIPGYALHRGQMTGTLKCRLDTALLAAQEFPEARIVLTGGAPRGGPTEAGLMQAYLISKGIDPDRILTEESSASSYENLLHCRTLWEQQNCPQTLLVTSALHVFRMRWTARHLQFPMKFVPSPVPTGLLLAETAREGMLLVKTALFGHASMAWAHGRL